MIFLSHYRFSWYVKVWNDQAKILTFYFPYYEFVFLSKVNPDTPAHACGLNAGDQVVSINGRNITHLSHQDAKMEITRSGNELELTVIK